MGLKWYIIAGEASGDLHGANLIKEIRKAHPDSEFRCWGGDRMEKEGATIVKHYRDLAFMGFLEVLLNLKTILRNIKFCKQDINQYKPDAVVLIDYPGFNLRIAEYAKSSGTKVFYYISPQVWAWKSSRVHEIKAHVDRLFAILPFEKQWFANYDYDVEFVGHPLLDEIDFSSENRAQFLDINNLPDKPIIAIVPGSRKQEIRKMLPLMLSAASQFENHQAVIAGAPSMDDQVYAPYLHAGVSIVKGQTYGLFSSAEKGFVTSGTATLEAALHGMPQVVCYKGGQVSYQIARRLVKINYISLVNLIMDREVVKELIQNQLTVDAMVQELRKFDSPEALSSIKAEYMALREKLGGSGASEKTAKSMLKILKGDSTLE